MLAINWSIQTESRKLQSANNSPLSALISNRGRTRMDRNIRTEIGTNIRDESCKEIRAFSVF